MDPEADSSAPPSQAIGQAAEFLVWAAVTAQSAGRLHVFLPLLDRGLDAVVHRLDDGSYLGVQVKVRTTERWHEAHVVVRAEELYDDSAVLIAGRLVDGALGPTLLVVPVGVFKERALFTSELGGRYEAWFPDASEPGTRWDEFVVPVSSLASRLMGSFAAVRPPRAPTTLEPGHDRWLGFLGEAEVIRRLAEVPELELYRPFPDLEMVEVLARSRGSLRFGGLQVKAPAWTPARRQAHAAVDISTLQPDASTFVAVLPWLVDAGRFVEECLLIPAAEVPRLGTRDGRFYLIEFALFAGRRRSRWDEFRVPLATLGGEVARRLSEPPGSRG